MAITITTFSQGLLVLSVLNCALWSSSDAAGQQEDWLKVTLFNKYDATEHPENTHLQYGIVYNRCPTVNADGKLISRVIESYLWMDRRLSWVPERHGNTRSLTVKVHDIWHPAMRLVDTTYTASANVGSSETATVHSLGQIHWTRSNEYHTYCNLDGRVWKCQLRFQASKYAGDEFILVQDEFSQRVFEASDCPGTSATTTIDRIGRPGSYFYYYIVDLEIPTDALF